MDNAYVRKLRVSKRLVGKKLYAAVALLLVASLLVSTATYAWLTLSLAPEATDITTTIGANGNLEIALATTDHLASLEANNMYDDDSNFEYTTGDPVHDNVLWGNLIDLTAVDYGLHVLNMRPAVLNVIDGTVADMPISVGAYGADGRLTSLDFSSDSIDLKTVGFAGVYDKDVADYVAGNVTMSVDDLKSGNYNKQELVDSVLEDADYGVRIAGPLEYSASLDQGENDANINLLVDGYCFAIDLLFRTNAPTGNLMLQTEGVQRMESELEDEYVGNGSFITISNEKLSAAMKVVFANTLTGEVYALAQADSDGKLWITARADENGTLVPTADDDAAMIKPLTQNQVSAVTAWVYIDGSLVDNSAAATKDAMEMMVNLQFSTDAVLNPAYTDKNTNPNYPNRPEMPINPDGTVSVGEKYVFGTYEQDNNLANGAEPIEWRCLAREGNKVLLISLYGLDAMAYYPINEDVTWETSAVRGWLNTTFIDSAFSSTEQNAILTTYLANDGVSRYGDIPEGNSTYDKVFLLSENEALTYFTDDEDRLATATAYAIANGAITEDINGVKNITCWWTRTPGAEAHTVTLVCGDGAVSGGIYLRNATNASISVRPAIWVNLDVNTDTESDTPSTDPTTPNDPSTPDAPTTNPTEPELNPGASANDGNVYYLAEGATDGSYTIYTLTSENVRDYQLMVTATLNESSNTLIISSVDSYPNGGVVIPAVVTADDTTAYSVALNGTSRPFYSLNVTDASITLLAVDDQFVGVSGNSTYSLFRTNSSTTLATLEVSALNTSNVTSMNSTFKECDSLISLDISDWDTSNVTNMDYMFYECSALASLNVGHFDTSNVKTMNYMFSWADDLTTLDVSNWDMSSVTSTRSMFQYCKGLTTLDVSKWDISSVSNLAYTFCGCENLTSLDVSDWDTSSVTSADRLFSDCEVVAVLDVSDWNTASIQNMNSMFSHCKNVKTLDVSNWDTSSVKTMQYMFYYCTSVENLDVSDWDTSNVTDMKYLFADCYNITSLNLSKWNTSKVENMSAMFLTSTPDNAGALTDLNISGIDTSAVIYMNSMFGNCSGLTELNLSHFDTSSVKTMYAMFAGCENLKSLNTAGWDTSSVTNMAQMFQSCEGFTTLDLSHFNTSSVTTMSSMFIYSYNLEEINLSSFNTSSVTDMHKMFYNCRSLESVITGDGWDTANADTTDIYTGTSISS